MHKRWQNTGQHPEQPQVDQWGRPVQPQVNETLPRQQVDQFGNPVDQWGRPLQTAAAPQPQVDQWGRPVQQTQQYVDQFGNPVDQWGRPLQTAPTPQPQVDQWGRPAQQPTSSWNSNPPKNARPTTGFGSSGQPTDTDVGGVKRNKKTRHVTRAEGYVPTTQPMVDEQPTEVKDGLKHNILVESGVERIIAYTEQNQAIDIYKGKTKNKGGLEMVNLDEDNTVPVPDSNVNGDYTYAKLMTALHTGDATLAYCLGKAEYVYSTSGNAVATGNKVIKTANLETTVRFSNSLLTTFVNSLLEASNVTVTIDNASDDMDDLNKHLKDKYSLTVAEYVSTVYSKLVENIKVKTGDTEETLTIPIAYIVSSLSDGLRELALDGVATLSEDSAPTTLATIIKIIEDNEGYVVQLLTDDCKYIVTTNEAKDKVALVEIK